MRTSYEVCVWYEILFHTVGQGELYSATPLCCSTDKMDKQTSVVGSDILCWYTTVLSVVFYSTE